jgi:hypothetical protein
MPYWIVALQIFNAVCDPNAATANSCHIVNRESIFTSLKDCQDNGEWAARKMLLSKNDVAVWWCSRHEDGSGHLAHDYQRDDD